MPNAYLALDSYEKKRNLKNNARSMRNTLIINIVFNETELCKSGKMHMFLKFLAVRALYRDARAFKFFFVQKTLLKWFSILLQNTYITCYSSALSKKTFFLIQRG